MPLTTLKTIIPGGWIFKQQETNWELPSTFRMAPFQMAAAEIANHRKKNKLPRETLVEASIDLENATCMRLGNDPRWCITESKKNSYNPQTRFQAAASHVLRAGTALVSGSRTVLSEMFGQSESPVSNDLAQSRADICLKCPLNQEDSLPLANTLAEAIKRHMEKKSEMKLSVNGEQDLKTCQICWCYLPLKVHVDLATILDRTPPGMRKKFAEQAPHCWLNKE